MKAVWKDRVVAESDATRIVEGNHYFPAESLRAEHFEPSDKRTTCSWKGEAHYRHVVVDDERNPDAAWTYPEPKPAAAEIAGYFAFWRGVEIAD